MKNLNPCSVNTKACVLSHNAYCLDKTTVDCYLDKKQAHWENTSNQGLELPNAVKHGSPKEAKTQILDLTL